MPIENIKLKEFQNRLDKIGDKASKPETPITIEQRQQGVQLAREYYQYLKDNGVPYGEAALQVVNNEGFFGQVANIHLRTQAVFDGVAKAYLPELQDRIKISLAYADIDQRIQHGADLPYKPISDYHKEIFKNQGLSHYAWGGLVVEQLLGPGKWMLLHDKDVIEVQNMLKQLNSTKLTNSEGYSVERMISSINHSLASYAAGESDYKPIINNVSKEDAARLFGVDLSRVEELPVDPFSEVGIGPLMDPSMSPGFPNRSFRILPKNQFEDRNDSVGSIEDEFLPYINATLEANKLINDQLKQISNSRTGYDKYVRSRIAEAENDLKEVEKFFPGILAESKLAFEQNKAFHGSIFDSGWGNDSEIRSVIDDTHERMQKIIPQLGSLVNLSKISENQSDQNEEDNDDNASFIKDLIGRTEVTMLGDDDRDFVASLLGETQKVVKSVESGDIFDFLKGFGT